MKYVTGISFIGHTQESGLHVYEIIRGISNSKKSNYLYPIFLIK